MRSKAQHERQRRLELRAARERELAMIQHAAEAADPRYVRDVASWIWSKIFDRKLRQLRQEAAELSRIDRQRLTQLLALEANWPAPARYARNLIFE